MLEPTTRHLFTDGLRPPSGYSVDVAVGTTYTLGLASLLLPPLAMAAHDRETSDGDDPGDSIALLEAVRRFADRMTVFCHAGAIHVPGQYRRILAFAEDSVIEALPHAEGHIFHPKMWVLRFTDGTQHRHRLLCLSRNLTADTSWDTIVQLEQADGGPIEGAPAGDFLRALPGLAVRPLASERAAQLADLASSVAGASFSVPEPFTRGELHPLGVGTGHGWPVPHGARNAVAISPFLDRPTVQRLNPSGRRVFVSREDTYAELGAAAFTGADVRVLDPLAETVIEQEQLDHGTPWSVRSGLHAKTFVWDYDRSGWCLTGSANATSAAFAGNVEFGVLLHGPRRSCGVDAFLPTEPLKGEVSLARVLVPYTIADLEPQADPTRAAEVAVTAYHSVLATARPALHVTTAEDGTRYDVQLAFSGALPEDPGRTTARLLSRAGEQHAQPIEGAPVWRDVTLADLTPFVTIRTTVTLEGGDELSLDCVLKADLIGAPEDRAARMLRSLLDSEDSVLRYLSFLLDESGADTLGLGLDGEREPNGDAGPSRPTFDDLAMLETLLRAAARGDESLTRVHSLLEDLKDEDGRPSVVSEEFLGVWAAVWAATARKEKAT